MKYHILHTLPTSDHYQKKWYLYADGKSAFSAYTQRNIDTKKIVYSNIAQMGTRSSKLNPKFEFKCRISN